MAHTCTCQMACGDTVSRVDWLHAIRLQMQLAHRPAAMSLYIAVSPLSPAHTRALTLVLGDDHTPVPCCSSPFAACRQHVCPSTSTQVTYDARADDCHIHHTQVSAKCEHKHGYTTDPAYTVMFLGGSNSHWIPGLQITAGVCICILGKGQDNQEQKIQGQEYHILLSVGIPGEKGPINNQSRQSRDLETPKFSVSLCLFLSLT